MPEQTRNAARRQRPTLIIGLGGTGKQVLLNLRRMFYSRYGKVTLPHVGNLWIDTDTRNVTLDGREMDFLMRQVDFSESEKLSTELSKDNLRNYYDHPEAHPEVFSWFDRRLERLQEIRDGAGGIRGFGRLSFYCHYERIKQRLVEKTAELARAASHNQGEDEFGMQIEGADPDYWLVFSVAGGTGAGMFLDMAFALKAELNAANIRGVIVLPSVFANDYQLRPFGNAYAALMELEHYSSVKDLGDSRRSEGLHAFTAAWTRDKFRTQRKQVRGPVFDTAYLVGNQPRGGKGKLTIHDKNALCQMIAEMLYIEYSPAPEAATLAAEVQSARSNFTDAINRIYSYPNKFEELEFVEPFACRYSAFGLSKLHIPVDRIATLTHYRLAKDFVESWTRVQHIPENLDEILERSMMHRIIADNSIKNRDFFRAIETSTDGKTLTNQVRALLWSARRDRVANEADSARIRGGIQSWIDEIATEQLDNSSPMRSRWGSMSQSIGQNQDAHFARVMAALDNLIAEWLGQSGYRFDVAREFLRRIRERLLKDKERHEAQAAQMRNTGATRMRDAQTLLGWLDPYRPGFTRRILVEVALENFESKLVKELQAQVMLACSRLCSQVADAIGEGQSAKDAEGKDIILETGLLKQLADLRQFLRGAVGMGIRERFDAYNVSDRSPIYQDLSAASEDIDRFYVDGSGRKVTEETVLEWERRFFEEGHTGTSAKSLWDMRGSLAEDGAKAFIERLVTFARRTLAHIQSQRVDVLERLAERAPADAKEYRAAVSNLLGFAEPWLASPSHFADHQEESPQLKQGFWVAASPGVNPLNLAQFSDVVKRISQRDVRIVGGAPDRVYAYSEVAGLPLMVIPDLDRYRNDSYLPLLERGEVLHTDLAFEKFHDLLIMQGTEVAEYVSALRTLLQAIILAVVEAKQDRLADQGDIVTYQFRSVGDGLFAKVHDLGPFAIAVRRLARQHDHDLRDTIDAQVKRVINNLRPEQRLEWYTLLEYHAQDPHSFFSRFAEGHIVRVILAETAKQFKGSGATSGTYSEITEAKARGKLDSLGEWTIEHPKNSGLYTLKLEDQ